MDVLCTHPVPLWMLLALDPGYAPQGSVPKAKVIPLQLLRFTDP
jgi:hypothetical protein